MDYETTHRALDRIRLVMDRNKKGKAMLKIASPSLAGYQDLPSSEAAVEAATDDLESPFTISNRAANARWLELYAFALTVSTLILGGQSLYMWLKPTAICVPPVIERGYDTEWGKKHCGMGGGEARLTELQDRQERQLSSSKLCLRALSDTTRLQTPTTENITPINRSMSARLDRKLTKLGRNS